MLEITPALAKLPVAHVGKVKPDSQSAKRPSNQTSQKKSGTSPSADDPSVHIDEIV